MARPPSQRQKSKRAVGKQYRQRSGAARASPRPPLRLPVGTIIASVMRALGRDVASVKERRLVLHELARMARPTDGGESDPTRERIMAYAAREWRSRCGAEFADVVLDFIGRLPKNADGAAVAAARDECAKVLQSQREHRYGNLVGTDSASVQLLEQFLGAYAIARRETSTGEPRQELLVLQQAGSSAKRTYATYITPEVVCRGRWYIVGDTIWCNMSGRRDTYNYDFANVQLARNTQNSRLLGGVLTGTATNSRLPTAIPVLAIRIVNATAETLDLGNKSDSGLRTAMGLVIRRTTEELKAGRQIELLANDVLSEPILDPTRLTADLAAKFQHDVAALVVKPLLDFCRSKHADLW